MFLQFNKQTLPNSPHRKELPMFRLAFASCLVVLTASTSASAGMFDRMPAYPSADYGISSEYVHALATADCGCGPQACGHRHHGLLRGHAHACRHNALGCCASLWSNYCADRHVGRHLGHCRQKLHSRYHWFAQPDCGCGYETAMPCCDAYPMCGHRHGRLTKGCPDACPSCLGHHVRGFWNRCRSHFADCGCGQPACDSCGGATDIIRIDEPALHEVPEEAPVIEAAPARPEAQEARLLPAFQALLPRN